jgi:hypothetical protein
MNDARTDTWTAAHMHTRTYIVDGHDVNEEAAALLLPNAHARDNRTERAYMSTYVCVYIYMYIYIYIYIYMLVYVCRYACICICICIYIYIHTFTYTYTYTCIHTADAYHVQERATAPSLPRQSDGKALPRWLQVSVSQSHMHAC